MARLLEVSDQSIRRWVKAGELRAYKPKKEYRIAESDLAEFLTERKVPLVQAPLPEFLEERREDVSGPALEAARRQHRQEAQATVRATESGQVQLPSRRHNNEALQRLLGYPAGKLAPAVQELAERVVDEELRPSALAPPVMAVVTHLQEIVSDSPAEDTAAAVYSFLRLEDNLSVLMGDEKRWARTTPLERAEIIQLMTAIEKLDELHRGRMDDEAGRAEVVDLDKLRDLRRRLEQSRETWHRTAAGTA